MTRGLRSFIRRSIHENVVGILHSPNNFIYNTPIHRNLFKKTLFKTGYYDNTEHFNTHLATLLPKIIETCLIPGYDYKNLGFITRVFRRMLDH